MNKSNIKGLSAETEADSNSTAHNQHVSQPIAKPNVMRRFGKMKTRKEIMQALKEMETRKKSYLLDMSSYKAPNSVVYDTELIRKLEVTDAVANALSWVLSKNGA